MPLARLFLPAAGNAERPQTSNIGGNDATEDLVVGDPGRDDQSEGRQQAALKHHCTGAVAKRQGIAPAAHPEQARVGDRAMAVFNQLGRSRPLRPRLLGTDSAISDQLRVDTVSGAPSVWHGLHHQPS